ncbi:YhdP family protein [Mycoavidus sp. SF9855]|uniref:YhdP family phospholipid transporter n=1 Tax=Mycoavidus sp. SF9855 TaxID=2968475 RepID=UPI00211CA126|nr:AsmA-like C-terminal region-containing protein [Mycoavidus sp. SF9855]UUM21647.1 hypothetical protein NQD60_00525 [Mycoavidus sp. SF9855]
MFAVFAGLVLIIFFGIAAAALTLRYGILPKLDTFRPRLEQAASHALGMQVSIGQLSGHWQALHPRIEISQLLLRDATGHANLIIPRASATLSWRSLLWFKPIFASLNIYAPEMTARRTADGRLSIAGIPAKIPLTERHNSKHTGLDWLLLQKTISLHNSMLHWQDEAQPNLALTLTSAQFTLFNHGDQQRTPPDISVHIRQLSARLEQTSILSDAAHNAPVNLIGRFDGRYCSPLTGRGERITLHGDLVDLRLLGKFAQLLPISPTLINQIARIKPRGVLRDYAIEWEQTPPATHADAAIARSNEAGNTPIAHYRFKAQLENIGVAAHTSALANTNAGQSPPVLFGFTNLSGSIDANETRGTLTLASKQTSITLKSIFDEPTLNFDTLTGKMHWQFKRLDSSTLLQVQLPHLSFANADAAGSVHAAWSNDASKQGYLKLSANFERLLVARVPRYLPTHINPKLRAYLKHALIGGVSRKAVIEVQGALEDFPFEDPQKPGVFYVLAPFEHGRFDPSSYPATDPSAKAITQWPALESIRGRFELDRSRLKVTADAARYRNVMLSKIKADINNISTHTDSLIISGLANGPLDDMLHYLNASPIPDWTTHLTDRLRASGNAQLKLRLEVPRDGREHTGVKGALNFADNGLNWGSLPPLTALTGQLDFTERTLTLVRPQAQWLGGRISGTGGVKASGFTAIVLNGQLSAQALQKVSHDSPLAALARHLNGTADYQINIQAPKHAAAQITATSDLTGLSLGLPAPFAKDSNTPMPLRLALKPARPTQAIHSASASRARTSQIPKPSTLSQRRLELQIGPLSATYLLHSNQQPAVVDGQIAIGEPVSAKICPKQRLPARCITATVNLEQLNLDAWLSTMSPLLTSPGLLATSKPLKNHAQANLLTTWSAWLPTHLHAQIKKLTAANRHWENPELNANRTGSGWQARLVSPQALGDLSWQPFLSAPSGTLRARFKYFTLPASMTAQEPTLTSKKLEDQANTLPAIDWIIDQLTVHGHALGKVEVAAHNTTDGNGTPIWQLDKLHILNPTATLNATGYWSLPRHQQIAQPPTPGAHNSPRQTALEFNLAINNAGDLLDHFGLPRTLRNGSGALVGKVSWQGTPIAIDYPSLNSSLSFNLQRGQILQVEPGIGKLLGVLSLQSLARFLMLDFRGIFGSGLTFDQIQGTGTVKNGIGYTDNFEILSPSARITMSGSTHIPQETQNLLVTVVPSIDAGSAALATAAINPLLGFSSYLAQLVLSAAISHNFSHQYAITGSWANPQIERIPSEASKIDLPIEAAPAQ